MTNNYNRRQAATMLGGLALACAMPSAFAQQGKPITIVVGFAAGGIADSIARIVGQALSVQLKQTVLVENRTGAGGTIAAAYVAKAPKDGSVLFLASNSHTITPSLMKLPFDAIADFAPVMAIAESPMVLMVKEDSPYKTVRELVEAGKSTRGLNYGSVTGTVMHVVTEMIAGQTKTNWRPVPYRGSAPALMDLMGGQVDFVLDFVQSSLPHIKAGKLRALAVLSRERSPQLPQVPTLSEALIPNFEAAGWYGVLAPAGTPDAILQSLNTALNIVVKQPDVQEKLQSLGSKSVAGSREEFAKRIRDDHRMWADVIATRGIKAD